MLLKYFYDQALAHASYLVGCQATGEALVVDAGRDVGPYLKAAAKEGMRIVGAVDTHIHADYVSGARELADRTGATLYVSDEGPPEWKFEYARDYPHQLLRDGDTFSVGNVAFEVMFTPGHTPESISLILTDRGGGADQPMGIFTGDFVFVGSVGRPDLLEEVAGQSGSAVPGARDLFKSIQRFKQLPDYLQVWPAHGAGSACGKGLGAVPSSTVGYEKRFNPALQFTEEEAFVADVLAEQPEAPPYFATMKRVNKEGPPLLGDATLPPKLDPGLLAEVVPDGVVIDVGAASRFARAHVGGTVCMPIDYLAPWAGWILKCDQPYYLIASPYELPQAVRILRKIGMDQLKGYFCSDEVAQAGLKTASIPVQSPLALSDAIVSGEVEAIDVRGLSERKQGRIPGSRHFFLGTLAERAEELRAIDRPLVFCCLGGVRSLIGASLARRAGVDEVINMAGGITAWQRAGLPVEDGKPQAVG